MLPVQTVLFVSVFVMEKPLFMLPSEPFNFCRYRFLFEVCMEVSVPNVPRCIHCVSEDFVLKPLYYGGVTWLRAPP